MPCERCSGLVVMDQYRDLYGNLRVLRCLNCGEVRDPRIDGHRIRPVRSKPRRPRQPCGKQKIDSRQA